MSSIINKLNNKYQEKQECKKIEYKIKNIIKNYEKISKNNNEIMPYQIVFLKTTPKEFNNYTIYFIESKANKNIYYNFYFDGKWKIYGKYEINISIDKLNEYFKYKEYVYLSGTDIIMIGNKKQGYTPLFLDDKGLKVLEYIEKLNSQKG